GRYTGPRPPPTVVQGLAKALGATSAAADSAVFRAATSWRCMNGAVYACNVGANLPCQAKANTERTPTTAEHRYCQEHPDQDFIPMAVTGHDTVYAWHCKGATPVAGEPVSAVDARGYLANIW